MNSSDVETLSKEIRKAAASIAQDWFDVTTPDDLVQETWVRISELTPARQESLLNLPPGVRMSQLRNWCRQAASQARDEYEVSTGNYRYAVSEVREMLDNRWLEHEPSYEGIVNERHLELLVGFRRLKLRNSDYSSEIIKRYVDGLIPRGGAAERKLRRAVDALAQEMNRSWISRNHEFDGVQLRREEVNGSV